MGDTIFLADESPWRRVYPGEKVQPVNWGSPFLRPTRIACVEATGKLAYNFVADAYNIYNVSGGNVSKVPCSLDTTIRDISSYCHGDCWPVALTKDGLVVDCQNGAADKLLKAKAPALLSVYATNPGQPLRSQRL